MKRIGLIAMSGVRAHNPELTKLGLTLPGFVDRNRIVASLPSLGLLTLAGLTPDRFEVEYHEIADLRQGGEPPDHFDLVAISTFTAQLKEAYTVADFYKARGIPVVMGGITVSSLPMETQAHCTSVVVGEGEPLWPEVLNDFENRALKPFYVQSPLGQFNLRDAPMPRFDLLDANKYNRITVQTSRGCPHQCEFCASSILLTSRYKLKPVEKVIAEIQEIKKIWPRPFIEFADDNSFVHREHYKKLLRELAREDLRWFTEADVRIAQEGELLSLMRDSGCQQVLIGLETPRAESLDGLELRANWKLRQQESYKAAIARIQSYGITVNGCFILGLDGDTPDVFDEIFAFVKDSNLYEVQITFLTPFSGHTALPTAQTGRPPHPGRRLGAVHLIRYQLPAQIDECRRAAERVFESRETPVLRIGNQRTPAEVQNHVEKICEFRSTSRASCPANGRLVERWLRLCSCKTVGVCKDWLA